MSNFYYTISGSNNDIISVQDEWWDWMEDGLIGLQGVGSRIYHNWTGSFASKSIEEYSPLWNEAKRQPLDSGSRARYSYNGSTIQPNSNVQNINYKSGSHTMNSDGTLTWK